MTLPSLVSYSLPQPDRFPAPRVSWSLAPQRSALLIHDMQEYFLRPFDANLAPLVEVLPNIKVIRALCDRLNVPVFLSAQPGEQDRTERGLLWDVWGPGIVSAPELQGFSPSLSPRAGDEVINKRRYSAFKDTSLLQSLGGRGRDQLLITGVYGHIGCLATALDAFMSGVQPFFVSDAVADFSLDDHLIAVRQVARTCGVVHTTAEVLLSLSESWVLQAVQTLLVESEDEIGLDDDLADLGLDSIRFMNLSHKLLFSQPTVEFETLIQARSVRALARLFVQQITQSNS